MPSPPRKLGFHDSRRNPGGYDTELNGPLAPSFTAPSQQEIANSVAATIFSVWHGQFIRNTVDMPLKMLALPVPPDQQALTTLQNLLVTFSTQQGFGLSSINFFQVSLVSRAEDRRDILILFSLQMALARRAGPAFFRAFQESHDQQLWWGKIHRIVFAHPMGSNFNIPPAMGGFPAPLPGLMGIPTDGGFSTVDAATHDVGGNTPDGFLFSIGPANRFVSQATEEMAAVSSLPGGVSGIIGTPDSINLLPGWLTNQAVPPLFHLDLGSVVKYAPPHTIRNHLRSVAVPVTDARYVRLHGG